MVRFDLGGSVPEVERERTWEWREATMMVLAAAWHGYECDHTHEPLGI
jgi:hypothetical protein